MDLRVEANHPKVGYRPGRAIAGVGSLGARASSAQSRAGGVRPADSCYQVVMLPPVFAYLDPGTGSMLVQLLVGGLAALAVAVKLWWYKILRVLRIRKPEPEPEQAPEP